jgi:hypothetical protein
MHPKLTKYDDLFFNRFFTKNFLFQAYHLLPHAILFNEDVCPRQMKSGCSKINMLDLCFRGCFYGNAKENRCFSRKKKVWQLYIVNILAETK